MNLLRWNRWLAVAGSLLFLSVPAGPQESLPKKRISILNFDNPSIGPDSPSGMFGTSGNNVGKGVSLHLIHKLLPVGKYTIIDQTAVEKLLKEQKDSDSERLDAYGLAAKIGRLLGLDAMIVGAVTQYGPKEKSGDTQRAAIAGILHSGVRTRKSKAVVEITAQVFNVTTGEIMATFTGAGESTNSGTITILPVREKSHPAVEMLGSEFVDSLFGEATAKAADQIAGQLNQFSDKIPPLRISIEGLVAEVAGDTVTLNVGTKSGVKLGTKLQILRDLASPNDSAGANTVQPAAERIGLATVTEVADDYATATFSVSAQPQVGDRVKSLEISPAIPH